MNLDLLIFALPLGSMLAFGLYLAFIRPEVTFSDARISSHLADISELAAVTKGTSLTVTELLEVAKSFFGGIQFRRGSRTKTAQNQTLSQAADFLEMLQLTITSGESIDRAILRIAQISGGGFGKNVRVCAAQISLGMPTTAALEKLATRAPVLENATRQMEVAERRGTPVATVLAECAGDLRAKLREKMIEASGKKEISMMIPLVFGIMPLSVLFAVYPGMALLSGGI